MTIESQALEETMRTQIGDCINNLRALDSEPPATVDHKGLASELKQLRQREIEIETLLGSASDRPARKDRLLRELLRLRHGCPRALMPLFVGINAQLDAAS